MTEPSVLPVPDLATAEGRAHYARSLDCVHCGLCLPVCPTYRLSGLESSSPRGRIYLMRAAADGRLAEKSDAYAEELAFCLVCRACETVCPSGVQFEALMEHARADERRARPLGFALRFLLERVLPSRRWLRTLAAILGPPSRSPLRGWLRSLDARATFFPTIPRRDERRELPALIPAQGERRGRVALLEGCVASQLLADVNHAAARVLSRAGFEVATWKSPSCCGALHAHAGELDFAARLAREHVAAFEASGADWFVHDSAGCGAHVRAFGRLLQHDPAWRERAARVAAASRDVTEFLVEQGVAPRRAPLDAKVAYHEACHLVHGQGVSSAPKKLLASIPGVKLVPLAGATDCCGAAGIYSLARPKDSLAVLESKMARIRESGCEIVATANPGCILQIRTGAERAGLNVRVVHPIQLVDAGEEPSATA